MLSKIIKKTFATTGSLFTWGQTTYGWGRTINNDFWTPGLVNNYYDIVSVSSGQYHLGFITQQNIVYTFGLEQNGRLGHPALVDEEIPRKVKIQSKSLIKQLSLGTRHSVALTQSGQVHVWGCINTLGHYDADTRQSQPNLIPSQYFNNQKIISIGAGNDFSAALSDQGRFYLWGDGLNQFPKWEQYEFINPTQSQQINHLLHKRHASIKKFFAIGSFLILLLDNGRLYCRGINNGGIFGARTNPLVLSDLKLSSFSKTYDALYKDQKIVDAQASSNSIIFRTQSNRIFYCGMNVKFQPALFPLQLNVKKMFATQSSVGVVTEDNKLYFLNQKLLDESELICKKNRVFLSQDENLSSQILDIGGKYSLRYALVK